MLTTGSHRIEAAPNKCTGCQRCQLICSLHHYNEFNLDVSRIIITESPQGVESITFTDDCVLCGLCVKYCVYGALKVRKRAQL